MFVFAIVIRRTCARSAERQDTPCRRRSVPRCLADLAAIADKTASLARIQPAHPVLGLCRKKCVVIRDSKCIPTRKMPALTIHHLIISYTELPWHPKFLFNSKFIR